VSAPTPSTIVFPVSGRIGPSDIRPLCEALRALLEEGYCELVICDVGALVDPDAAAVDALGQLQLTTRRLGCRMRLRDPSVELLELIVFMGLGKPAGSSSCRRRVASWGR
jgi:anti-anti-sigma regulatory factor